MNDADPDRPTILPPGSRVAHYEILGLLGQGGMGVVYRARDLNLDRAVALKRPLKRFLTNPKTRQRFLREAKVTSQLQHPNIITIFEVFEEGGFDWLAMEHIEGEGLGDYLDRYGALSPRRVLRLAEGLVEHDQLRARRPRASAAATALWRLPTWSFW